MTQIKIGSLTSALESELQRLVDVARTEIVIECFKIYRNNIQKRKGWTRRSYSNSATGDLDFETPPLRTEKAGEGYSVVEAIMWELTKSYSVTQRLVENDRNLTYFEIGHVPTLLEMSPRWIYYEFGTLGSQESTGTLKIGSFGQWQNPHVPWSRLRVENPGIDWVFRKLRNVGRFGMGVMMPEGTTGGVPNKPIPPIRMYRGSAEVSKKEILQSQGKILKQVIKKARTR